MPVDPTLIYHQATGEIATNDGGFVAFGWAGNGLGKNNADMQEVHDVGPLPRGSYRVGPWEAQHPDLGPLVAHLEQIEGETFGRSGFYFHGPAMDAAKHGQESKGCIVVPHSWRVIVQSKAPEGSIVQVVV